MKIMNTMEALQVAGGLTYRGVDIPIDTSGIPSNCVRQLDAFGIDVFRLAERTEVSATALLNVMGPHLDAMMATGCDAYLDLYTARIKALTSRYA
ncbi:MAG: hypothetical protein AB7I18_13020 [Candidatus Berkiella sp.]